MVFAFATSPAKLVQVGGLDAHNMEESVAKGLDKNLPPDLGGKRREEESVGLGRERVPDLDVGERARGNVVHGLEIVRR